MFLFSHPNVFFVFFFSFSAAGTITCQIDSADRDECIKEAIQDMLPKLVVSVEANF